MYTHIIKSTKKQTNVSTKKSLTDDLSKRLLQLEFKSNHSIKSNCLKWIVETFYQITKNQNHSIKNKTDKNWRKEQRIVQGVKILHIILGHKK